MPPSLSFDRVHGGGSYSGLEGVLDFDHSSASGDDDQYGHHGETAQYYDFGDPSDSIPNPQTAYGHNLTELSNPAQTEQCLGQPDYSYNAVTSMPMTLPETYQNPTSFQPINATLAQPLHDNETWEDSQGTAADLSAVLGQLNIEENGVGMS